ncbi:erythromycin esterase family protein [Telluribacter sp.]|jgi:erythromycin esterase-like protein|uniref:erythromycin esterase family protein n=1 Tax=Telluribacter sp. TaxID=1978767 RepID=UPI002E117803|nr:erythromycin esterase family protein [Telluribacter sp.]
MNRIKMWDWKRGSILFALCLLSLGCKNNLSPQSNNDDTVTLTIPHHPLRNEQDLDVLLNEIGDARVVLLGEASHGTSEYYTWRAAISRRLIQEKGFDFIAVEGEWADSYRVNNFIKGEKKDSAAAVNVLRQYDRWPTWMWGNYEVASLVTWLNAHNQSRTTQEKVGFYGLDVYCLWESMTELMPYIQGADPALVKAAQNVHQCFQPFSADAQEYARAVANASADCRVETSKLWNTISKQSNGTPRIEALFVAQQNALVALNGERYYRSMVSSNTESWNIRDRHMAQTLRRLLDFHGPDSKAIVWEHNTHVGDARYTDMVNSGEVNVGQLAREEYGQDNVYLVGFGSYSGTVIAGSSWGAPLQTMPVPEAMPGSWEQILHELSPTNKIILSKDIQANEYLSKRIGHRAIGVVYNPAIEQRGNYVPSVLPKRYDAFLFIDQTRALRPILPPTSATQPPDTYPSGH